MKAKESGWVHGSFTIFSRRLPEMKWKGKAKGQGKRTGKEGRVCINILLLGSETPLVPGGSYKGET